MNEQPSAEDALFTGNAKRVLDDSVDRLDARVAGRLQRARCEVLASSHRSSWIGWTRGLAAASVVFVVLIFLVGRSDVDYQLQPILEDQDLDVMTSTENADLSEDLEFYDWLADSSTTG